MTTLQWSENTTFFKPRLAQGEHAWFTLASLPHAWSGVWSYWALTRLLPTWSSLQRLALGTAAHTVEDYAENTGSLLSVEKSVSKLLRCHMKGWLEPSDHDSMQNFIGDNVSFLLGAWIASRSTAVPSWQKIGAAIAAHIGLYAALCYIR